MTRRVALFGGSFDPVHHGHLIIARSVAEILDIDQVILLPSRTPPHKPETVLAAESHRAAMVRLAIDGEALFGFSDHDLTCTGPSYTINTVDALKSTLPAETELLWIIGADSLGELHTWHRIGELVERCRLVTAGRPGHAVPDWFALRQAVGAAAARQLIADAVPSPQIEISATVIRERVAAGKSIRYLVPQTVADYIAEHGLYR